MTAASLAIDVAGAVLFALVGVGVLLLSRGRGRGLLVGAAATTFGVTWVFQNFGAGGAWGVVVGLTISSALGTVAFVALAHHLARGLSSAARRRILVIGVVLVGLWLAGLVVFARIGTFGASALIAGVYTAYHAFILALVLFVAAVAVAFREAEADRRALASLGLAFGLFVTFLITGFAGSVGFSGDFGNGDDLILLAVGCTTALAILPFAHTGAHPDRLSRAVFPLLIASGLGGLLLVLAPGAYDGYGAFGIIRTLGAFFLALAVLRFDLLGVELPRLAARRGTLATGALAALFIVAQVAQEFLAAEYGLLMGGVVAGALLFAANPIQRAMERESDRGPSPARIEPDAAARRRENERVYRMALERFHADRRLTPDEELALAHMADELGISARRATELRHEALGSMGLREGGR